MLSQAPGRTEYQRAAELSTVENVLQEPVTEEVAALRSKITCLLQMKSEGKLQSRPANLARYDLEDAPTDAVVDAQLSYVEAVVNGLRDDCPEELLAKQTLLEVYYISFDGLTHKGQIVVHEELIHEVEAAFAAAFKTKFPIRSAIPVSQFGWDDDASMRADNSSAFNYRTIAGTDIMSRHAQGRAVDINPLLNPHYRTDGSIVPEGAIYEAGNPGVLVDGDAVVSTFKAHGWAWGAEWPGEQDWQHFDKA